MAGNKERFEWHIERPMFEDSYALTLFDRELKSIVSTGVQKLVKVEEGLTYEPTLKLGGHSGREILTNLAKSLHQAGFCGCPAREGNDELGAVRDHLKDMRRLVFRAAPQPGREDK